MYHQHFNSIGSTQIYLKENLAQLKKESKWNEILISCSEQTNGIGQRGNQWDTYSNSLAMSFTVKPNATASLTPIEIGILVIHFIKLKFNLDLHLKWPNDILDIDFKKCGGIICHYIDSETVVVGLGINLGEVLKPNAKNYRHGFSTLIQNLKLTPADQENLSKEFYHFALTNRLIDTNELITLFNQHCAHLNKIVIISENNIEIEGDFVGIGDNGDALIKINDELKSFLSSSLTIKY